ncbi:UNVERIFIED_CONTAM: hypothetical protein PYX00_000634 [Menopon gallinae]|uniref:Uncharacterized protein n=1 Tax=Menopon gallinae TaxID=328185 RepID=A0AAW2IAU1_9NEOP
MSGSAIAVALLSMATTLMAAYPQLQPQYFQYQSNPYYQPVAVHPVAVQPMVVPVVYRQQNITNSTFQIKGHDFALGAPSPREKVLLHTTVYKKPGLWSSFATKEITFPPRGSHLRVNITRIYATDRARNGTGAFVKLTNGGIGQQNVTLLFRSQKNQPINFELDIFGYPK